MYQVPKKDHPWRRYKDRRKKELAVEAKNEKPEHKTVQILLTEIVTNWNDVEITTSFSGGSGRYTLNELPQVKQAAYIAGMLKRNYG